MTDRAAEILHAMALLNRATVEHECRSGLAPCKTCDKRDAAYQELRQWIHAQSAPSVPEAPELRKPCIDGTHAFDRDTDVCAKCGWHRDKVLGWCAIPILVPEAPEPAKASGWVPVEGDELVTVLTAAMREADRAFERVGGSTRHHVRDCLIPVLERMGLAFVSSGPVQDASLPESK